MSGKKKRKNLAFGVRKYYRWMRLYLRRVRAIEQELGGMLEAC